MATEDELRKRYMQSRGMSAAGGAAKGAAAGTAIMPGVGSAIGAGLGGIAGWISGGPSEAERLRDEQLKELLRKQEMDALGLDPRRRAILEAEARAGQEEMAMGGITEVGAGSAFAAQLAQQDQQDKREAAFQRNIMLQDQQERERQEAEIARMQNQQLKEQQEDREALMNDIQAAMSSPAMLEEFEYMFAEEVGTTEKQAAKVSEVDAATVSTLIKLAGQYGLGL